MVAEAIETYNNVSVYMEFRFENTKMYIINIINKPINLILERKLRNGFTNFIKKKIAIRLHKTNLD
jgi:hypothetical protein